MTSCLRNKLRPARRVAIRLRPATPDSKLSIPRTQRPQAKRRGGGNDDGASSSAAAAPQRWSDYTVEFHFPEPTELPPPLMQLIDVDFKYPGRCVHGHELGHGHGHGGPVWDVRLDGIGSGTGGGRLIKMVLRPGVARASPEVR